MCLCRRQMAAAAADAGDGGGPAGRQRCATTAEYCSELRLWMAQVRQTRCMEAMFPIWLSQQLAAGSVSQQQQQQQQQQVWCLRFGVQGR